MNKLTRRKILAASPSVLTGAAAQALGLHGQVRFDLARHSVMVALALAPVVASLWFKAITERQCTCGLYDGMPLNTQDLVLLEGAGSADYVRVLLLTAKGAINKVLFHLMQGNSQQLNVKAFVTELKSWIRFNAADAVERGAGLFWQVFRQPVPADVARHSRVWTGCDSQVKKRKVHQAVAQLRLCGGAGMRSAATLLT